MILEGSPVATKLTHRKVRDVWGTLECTGRPLEAKDANGANYVTSATYAPSGSLTGMTNGWVSGGFAGIVTSNSYNSRQQPILLTAATTGSGGQTILNLGYDFHSGSGDNGNVYQIVNYRDTARTQNFTYDALNRIKTAATQGTTGSTCWGQMFGHMSGSTFVPGIDAWGNLNEITNTQCSVQTLSQTSTVKNQISGFCYDIAGNLLSQLASCPSSVPYYPTYVYDAENRLRSINQTITPFYTYDGDGKRVIKNFVGSNRLYWTGTGSDTLTETDLSGTPTADYIYFNGKRIARVDLPGGAVRYYFSDHLGTASVITDNLGVIKEESDYYPYGGERVITNGDSNRYKFTGKERDSESGLDNFGARYYGSSLGRFTQTDPIWVKTDRILDPQRLNLYGYGRNNPLRFTDPTGMDLKMGNCPATSTISMCEAAITNGLKKEDRSHVHFVQGDGKNGFKKGEIGITVDKDYKSSSGDFSNLQSAANNHDGTAAVNIVAPNSAIPTLMGVQSGKTRPFQDVMRERLSQYGATKFDNYVSAAEQAYGQTLFPVIGDAVPEALYTPSADTQMYLAADNSAAEMTGTFYHELVHVVLGDFGRSVGKSGHDVPGVTDKTNAAQDEAKKNFENQ